MNYFNGCEIDMNVLTFIKQQVQGPAADTDFIETNTLSDLCSHYWNKG